MAFSFTARLCRTNMHMRFRFEVRPDIDLTVYVRAWGVVGLERVGTAFPQFFGCGIAFLLFFHSKLT